MIETKTKNPILKYGVFCFYCKKIVEPVSLFLIILSFSYWSNPNLSPQISPDGQGYWELAKNFKSEVGLIRPFFFPFFIKLCMIISNENWQEIFSFLALNLSIHQVSMFIFIHKKLNIT